MKYLVLFTLLAQSLQGFALWPQPQSLTAGLEPLRLSSSFEIVPPQDPPQDLLLMIQEISSFILNDNHQILESGRGIRRRDSITSAAELKQLHLVPAPAWIPETIADHSRRPLGLESRLEGYTLSIPLEGGSATVTANSSLGLFRGMTTFSQLWYKLKDDGIVYTPQAPIEIVDYPAFPYRGFLLDTSRHFYPLVAIERTLDAMSWVKLNTFHWHITDSQSFPFSIPGYTELAEKGAYSPDMIYSEEDVRHIIAYAGTRGIDVLLEIDTPGHSAAIAKSHPEHIACDGQLQFASEATTNFTAGIFSAVSDVALSSLVGTGGDELTDCFETDAYSQMVLNGRMLHQALNQFVNATHDALREKGKTPVVWQEIAIEYPDLQLDRNTIVAIWKSSEDARIAISKGFRVILAPASFFYLDCGGGGWLLRDNVDAANSWCDPFKTWMKAYSFNPYDGLQDGDHAFVLGGQQQLWSEQSSQENLDSSVWPRAASSAEVFWSGPVDSNLPGRLRAAYPRLQDLRYRMVQRGVRAIPIGPHSCALDPQSCFM